MTASGGSGSTEHRELKAAYEVQEAASVYKCGWRELERDGMPDKPFNEASTDSTSRLDPDMYPRGDGEHSRTLTMSEPIRLLSGVLGCVCLFKTAVRPVSASGVLSAVLGLAFLYNALKGYNWKQARCKRKVTARYYRWINRMSQTDIMCTIGPYRYRAGIRA